jgi:hypothetical protein
MEEVKIPSYPSIYAYGHAALKELLADPVVIQEKVDGSQFSFLKLDGKYYARSKGQQLFVESPEQMFAEGCAAIKELDLTNGWIYRGEYLRIPKHNSIQYSRTPNNHVILYDIETSPSNFLSYKDMTNESSRLSLEFVPMFDIEINLDNLKKCLESESILGGSKIEGVVIKNYQRFGKDKKVLMGKYVREDFQETNAKEWKEKKTGQMAILHQLIAEYKSPTRWEKAYQHLRDNGLLSQQLQDIPLLLKEAKHDLRKECEDEIKSKLFKWVIDDLERASVGGLPEWYKNKLAELQQ